MFKKLYKKIVPLLVSLLLPISAFAVPGGDLNLTNKASLVSRTGFPLILGSQSTDGLKFNVNGTQVGTITASGLTGFTLVTTTLTSPIIDGIVTSAATFPFTFQADANRKITLGCSSDTLCTAQFGDGATAAQELRVSGTTLNDGRIGISGGSAAFSSTAGGQINSFGATHATKPGYIELVSANVASSQVLIDARGTGSKVYIANGGTAEIAIDDVSINPQAVAGNALGTAALPWAQVIQGGVAIDADVTGIRGNSAIFSAMNNSTTADNANFIAYGANTVGANLGLFKTRATTTDANTIVSASDQIGNIVFYGADGATYRAAASIIATVDGTPGSSDMPGNIIFSTTPDGQAAPTEKFRITHGGRLIGGGLGELDGDITTILGSTPIFTSVSDADQSAQFNAVNVGADSTGADLNLIKTRSTTGDANTIVQNGDTIGRVMFRAADGANYVNAARILVSVDGTPGTTDMPTRMDFQVSPDGSATTASALKITNDKKVTLAGALANSATSYSCVLLTGANTACTTTCTTGCLFGYDSGTNLPVACETATADACICCK